MKSVIIVANGTAERYGKNKMTEDVIGQKLLQRTAAVFYAVCDQIIIVSDNFSPEDIPYAKFVAGGKNRTESVKCGLAALSDDCTLVAVHDGARPFLSAQLAVTLFEHAQQYGSAVPYLPLTDTVWRKQEDNILPDIRENLIAVQTPQVYDKKLLVEAFKKAKGSFTDESTLFYSVYNKVHFVEGKKSNYKITYTGDLPDYRIGTGFDVHAFGFGNQLIIGGVKIPYEKSLVGHSDADVLLHAVTDAVLTATQQKDIGTLFPDTDNQYLGIDSKILLQRAANNASAQGWEVCNVSAVIICEQPKMSPYIDCMASNIATVLQIPPQNVNLSATTTEKLGALGQGDGIACQATALVVKK